MSLVWTREQEEELASLYQEYREEEGKGYHNTGLPTGCL